MNGLSKETSKYANRKNKKVSRFINSHAEPIDWLKMKCVGVNDVIDYSGLVSFDLVEPIKKLMLIRTDGALSDDRILHIFNELLNYQKKHYVRVLIHPNLSNPSDNLCAVVNEKETSNFDATYGLDCLDGVSRP